MRKYLLTADGNGVDDVGDDEGNGRRRTELPRVNDGYFDSEEDSPRTVEVRWAENMANGRREQRQRHQRR